jgi:DNA-binding transcriptional LysR family regulator
MKQSNIDLNTLKTLLDVVEAGSFAAAARERNLPPNNLSRQVQRLERDLGIRLLQRTTRSLGLTSSGRELVEGARGALAQLEQQLQDVGSQGKEPRGHLRVAVPTDFFSLRVAEPIARFLEQHPGISLEFLLSDDQVDLIDSGVDLAVRAGVIRDEHLVARQLAESRLIVVASPACVARHGDAQTLKALAAYPCLAARGRNGQANAKAGLGAALVPRGLVRASLADGSLVQIMNRYHCHSPGVFVVYPSRRHQSAALKKFVELLLEEAAKLR